MPEPTQPDSPTDRRRLTRAELLVAAAFFVSGAAGLVYQVAWQRVLALHSGVGIYSVAMIVASFMAGLGLGSLLGGRLTVRFSPRMALRTFGLLELTIGAFGAASCWLYYDLLYLRGSWLYGTAWRAGLLHFLGLLLPTALMGMTLPFLVRASVRDVPSAGRTIGLLYGLNVLGASLGALVTPWVLIRFSGIRGAVLAAAAANVVSGGTAVLLRLHAPRARGGLGDERDHDERDVTRARPLGDALWPLGLRRAVARDPVVPRARRRREGFGLRLRHAARALPPGHGAGLPGGGRARASASRSRCAPSWSASACCWSGRGWRWSRSGSCRSRRPASKPSTTTGGGAWASSSVRPESRGSWCASTSCFRSCSSACRPC